MITIVGEMMEKTGIAKNIHGRGSESLYKYRI
jgi:hypothetical protein